MSVIQNFYQSNEKLIFWCLFAIFIVVIPLLLVWQTVNLYQQEKQNRIVLDIN